MSTPDPRIAAGRARLAAIEGSLKRLRLQHDRAMSAFDFEEAATLGRDIAALEREEADLAKTVPPPAPVLDEPMVPRMATLRPRARRARR